MLDDLSSSGVQSITSVEQEAPPVIFNENRFASEELFRSTAHTFNSSFPGANQSGGCRDSRGFCGQQWHRHSQNGRVIIFIGDRAYDDLKICLKTPELVENAPRWHTSNYCVTTIRECLIERFGDLSGYLLKLDPLNKGADCIRLFPKLDWIESSDRSNLYHFRLESLTFKLLTTFSIERLIIFSFRGKVHESLMLEASVSNLNLAECECALKSSTACPTRICETEVKRHQEGSTCGGMLNMSSLSPIRAFSFRPSPQQVTLGLFPYKFFAYLKLQKLCSRPRASSPPPSPLVSSDDKESGATESSPRRS